MKRSFDQTSIAASTGVSEAVSSALNPTTALAVDKKRQKQSETAASTNRVKQGKGK